MYVCTFNNPNSYSKAPSISEGATVSSSIVMINTAKTDNELENQW